MENSLNIIPARTALAPFSFKCKFCKEEVDAGLLLERKDSLDLVCPTCAKNYVYALNFVLPVSVNNYTIGNLASNITPETK